MISTHILDTTKGVAPHNVEVLLEKRENDNWIEIDRQKTNADGRIVFNDHPTAGVYRLTFMIEDYFQGEEHFFMNSPVVFQIKNTGREYHVPLLLNPYGFSTYRGT